MHGFCLDRQVDARKAERGLWVRISTRASAGGTEDDDIRAATRIRRDQVAVPMALPLFLRGLVIVLLAFGVATYLITGSLWTTVFNTIVVAVLVQVGYFGAVLFMVWRSPRASELGRGAGKREVAQGPAKEDKPAAEIARVPGRPSSPQT